ncbi:MAG TPA: hypothetical protein PK867_17725, partial [Pirellulales bacterium]|nr:hypothetical protein [Pirellulales bacterium]
GRDHLHQPEHVRLDPAHDLATSGGHFPALNDPRPKASDADAPCAAEILATALGVVQARDVLLAEHWIVLVADARSSLSSACQEQIRLLARAKRLLVVWCERDDAGPLYDAAQNRKTLEELLSRSDLPHVGLLSGVTGDDLVSIFHALKVMGQASLVMLRLRSAEAARGDDDLPTANPGRPFAERSAPPEVAGTVTDSLSEKATSTAVESALVEMALGEPRVVVVDLRPMATADFARRLAQRYVASGADDAYVWQRSIGLMAGGCRPLLLLTEHQWAAAATALATLPEEVELRATAVVFRDPRSPPKSHLPPALWPTETTVAARDLRHFEDLLTLSLGREGLTVIETPLDASATATGGQLRFDRAEPLGAERQTAAAQAEREEILAKRFSAELASWIAAYEQVGERGGYLWKWCLHGVELTTLDCVRPALWADVCDTKVLAGMLNVLVDDVADQQGRGDLLDELLKLTHHERPQLQGLGAADRRYGEFTCEVWDAVWRRAKRYPCYDPYTMLLQFDLTQLFNTVHYSHLVNSNPYILNVVEHDDYSPQGMGLLGFAMIDLMCSPDFSVTELGRLREAMWHAQWMARIGNLMTTWQREVYDRDYSSGVFAHAVANHDLTVDQLMNGSPALITAAITRGGHEAYFHRRWREHRIQFQRLLPQVASVDLAVTLLGLDRLLQTELVSRGAK